MPSGDLRFFFPMLNFVIDVGKEVGQEVGKYITESSRYYYLIVVDKDASIKDKNREVGRIFGGTVHKQTKKG
jgi:hypothetical protein